ncbi:DUF6962 family protein [candidate division KSB1 bacterium]
MNIADPSNFVTNIIYSAVSFFLAIKLIILCRENPRRSIRYWACFFIFAGFTTLAAAFYHGSQNIFDQPVIDNLKKTYQIGAGFQSFFVVLAIIHVHFRDSVIKWIKLTVLIKLIVYSAFIISSLRNVIFIFFDYVPAVLFVLVIEIIYYAKTRSVSSRYIIYGMVMMFIGVAVQRSDFDPFQYLNNDDLFHLINTFSMVLLYKGGVLFKDKS